MSEEKKKKPTIRDISKAFYEAYGFEEVRGQRKQVLQYWRKSWYRWKEGTYYEEDAEKIKSLITMFVEQAMGMDATPMMMSAILMSLGSKCFLDSNRVPDTWLTTQENMKKAENILVMKNKVLRISDRGDVEVLEHTPDLFSITKLDYDYDPEATCPLWDDVRAASTIVDRTMERTLWQWAGYGLINTQKFERFLILTGDAGAGKGTYKRTLMAMLGKENCTEVPLRRFTERFSLSLTYGKKLNTAPDASSELTPQIEEIIKTWTGEDGLDFEKKYFGVFTAEPTAKLMILTNDFPAFTDKSEGMWRRIIVVPFDRVDRDDRDPDLEAKLSKELPGILNWALAGLKDLLTNGDGFYISETSKQTLKVHKEESNPAGIFLRENYTYDAGAIVGVKTDDIYMAYRIWYSEKGYCRKPENDKAFGKEVKRVFPMTRKRRLGMREFRYHMYQGVVVQPHAEIKDILARKSKDRESRKQQRRSESQEG